MNSNYNKLKTHGYIYQSKSIIKEESKYFQKVVRKYFSKEVEYYNTLII